MKHDKNRKKSGELPLLSRISEKTGLPLDVLSGCPYLQLYGGRCLIIEGKNRIEQYDERVLTVRCGENLLQIEGQKLRVSLLDRDALCINGTITALFLTRQPKR